MENFYIKKYFESNLNGPEDGQFHINLQKFSMKFIKENINEIFEAKKKFYLIYLAVYGLIILLTRRKSLEFKNDKKRNIFCFDDLITDKGKMKIIFNRINQATTLYEIFSDPSI